MHLDSDDLVERFFDDVGGDLFDEWLAQQLEKGELVRCEGCSDVYTTRNDLNEKGLCELCAEDDQP